MRIIKSIQNRIYEIMGERVLLDFDLAVLYEVPTKVLNQAVKRNIKRFPKDFMFQLTKEELEELRLQIETSETGDSSRSQIVTLKKGQNIKYRPHVFTEHGAIMLASVLNSRVAVKASVYVVRAFIQMRAALAEYTHLSLRLDTLEAKYDGRFAAVFDAIRQLMSLPTKPRRRIGFLQADRPVKKT